MLVSASSKNQAVKDHLFIEPARYKNYIKYQNKKNIFLVSHGLWHGTGD